MACGDEFLQLASLALKYDAGFGGLAASSTGHVSSSPVCAMG